MKRRTQRAHSSSISLKQIRFILALITLSLIFTTATYGKERTIAKEMNPVKRLSILKTSKWIENELNIGDEFHSQKALAIKDKRRKLIADIESLLRKKPSLKTSNNLKLRLAHMYLEEYYTRLGSNEGSSEYYLGKAHKTYLELQKTLPDGEGRDEVLYFSALININQGKPEVGMQLFDDLRGKYPKSRYTPDAITQLGDHYFEKQEYQKAEDVYQQLVQLKYKPLLAYVVYKKAWCEYNLDRIPSSLSLFQWVIQNEAKLNPTKNTFNVRNEAANDAAFPLSRLSDTEKARAFYKPLGTPVYRTGITHVASLWQDRGSYTLAEPLWRELLALDPFHPSNPTYELNLFESFKRQNKHDEATKHLLDPLPRYVSGSEWFSKQNRKDAVATLQNWEEEARRFILHLNATYQTSKTVELLDLVKYGYRNYLTHFNDSAEAPAMRTNLAVLEFNSQEFENAGHNYLLVSKTVKDPKLAEEALYNSISSFGRLMNNERKAKGLSEINHTTNAKMQINEKEKMAYSKTETLFMDLVRTYGKQYKNQKETYELLHEVAYLEYIHNDLSTAEDHFRELSYQTVSKPVAISSSFLLLDILNQRADYDGLISESTKLIASGPKDAQYQSQVKSILRQGELKKIAIAESKGNFEDAGKGYLQFATKYGQEDPKNHEIALFNASVNLTKANLFREANSAEEMYLRAFPKGARAEEVGLKVARYHEETGSFSKAAEAYEKFAKANPKHKQSDEALRIAGFLYWGAGLNTKAEKAFLKFTDLYPNQKSAIKSDLDEFYASTGLAYKQRLLHEDILKTEANLSPAKELIHRDAIAEIRARKRGRLDTKELEENLAFADDHKKQIKRDPIASDIYAKLKLWSLIKDERQFSRLALRLPQRVMERNLKAKLDLIKHLEAEYTSIPKLGSVNWGLAAIYKTAALYKSISAEIAAAPVPSELKSAQLEMYRKEIDQSLVQPLRKKAVAFADKCLKQAETLQAISVWTDKCYQLSQSLNGSDGMTIRTAYLPSVFTQDAELPEGSITEEGSEESLSYPMNVPFLYREAGIAQNSSVLENLLSRNEMEDLSASPTAPVRMTYGGVSSELKSRIGRHIASEKGASEKTGYSYSYLNSLRLSDAKGSISYIQDALKRDPQNIALQNLLGLAYLESGNTNGARVQWILMKARYGKKSFIENNLGVLALLEGNEQKAIHKFQAASTIEGGTSAASNLGFMALKYRNPTLASNYFEAFIKAQPNTRIQEVGKLVALMQKRDLATVKNEVATLAKQLPEDPYIRLSVAFYLMDGEKDFQLAQRIVTDYVRTRKSLETDLLFRNVLKEAESKAIAEEVAEEEVNEDLVTPQQASLNVP